MLKNILSYIAFLKMMKKNHHKKYTIKEVIQRGGISLVIAEIYRIIMRIIIFLYNVFLALFGVTFAISGDYFPAFILFLGVVTLYILFLEKNAEMDVFRWFSKKVNRSLKKLKIITFIYYPFILAVQTAFIGWALSVKILL